MSIFGFSRYALLSCAAAAMLAGCGGSQPPMGAPSVVPLTAALAARTDSTNFKVVYSFAGGSDGLHPYAGLLNVGGTLYGTTAGGGAYVCGNERYGCGTVFSVTLGGTERVLHSFAAGSDDGSNPQAGLIDVGGTLYGTTEMGGHNCYSSHSVSCGTVFSITTSGAEKLLYAFRGIYDGSFPYAALIDVKGTLYGTTYQGGYICNFYGYYGACGTVFSVTLGGTEKVVHTFLGRPDGSLPLAGLINVNGILYGTTNWGGEHKCRCGTVFSITPGGTEKVLHRFHGGSDGAYPAASLIEQKGKLYGTTGYGGPYCGNEGGGCGTVFSITPGGKVRVLHYFGNGTDGTTPNGSLIAVKGKLYGTTISGGSGTCRYGSYLFGCGTVFSITPGGTEKVLHSFSGTDGEWPYAALIYVKSRLYGTTESGGANSCGETFGGCGTVFALTP